MARYEIRIAFEDPADAKVQHQRWSIACDAGRSPIEGADRPRLVRLRDRTGPSVAARLSALESLHLVELEERGRILQKLAALGHENDTHSKLVGTIAEEHDGRLDALEAALEEAKTEHAALVVRVGELEMLPDQPTDRAWMAYYSVAATESQEQDK